MTRRVPFTFILLGLIGLPGPGPGAALEGLFRGERETELAPHGRGNVYAPDVLVEGGLHRMWYGGQGRDGHDRIHSAESRDGRSWERRGVAIDIDGANHVNDPSVVLVDGTYYLYYTRASAGVVDEIALATSRDGREWRGRGVVLRPDEAGRWDGLLVGRPSVLHADGVFRMWYDGRKDLPTGAPAAGVPTLPSSRRSVGLATSKDGLTWTRHADNPVFGGDAGGVDVERAGEGYAMVYESHQGTRAATSPDGVAWRDLGLVVPRSGGPADAAGHVTPMLLAGSRWLYLGAAPAATWDRNAIARIELSPGLVDRMTPRAPGS